ncbi:helix-turn-helix domain-containing protein [Snodgrassella sp. CFCC 13594]|uniref:winged helix-turn-helix transcriptional regulator n=1 Tax=Snodgrassella sp. CFCC 13594 TaxID=1775559 RepID=UPI0008301B32|nr:helix-turn-helix domain-containing protein [Snodgrassella sp. CFCC 13594]
MKTPIDNQDRGQVLSKDCPSRLILQHLTNRWGVLIMFCLSDGTHRFSALRRRIQGISEKMLTQSLKDLEQDGFVLRTVYPEIPPHVDYRLSPLGREAAARIVGLVSWIETSLTDILASHPNEEDGRRDAVAYDAQTT